MGFADANTALAKMCAALRDRSITSLSPNPQQQRAAAAWQDHCSLLQLAVEANNVPFSVCV